MKRHIKIEFQRVKKLQHHLIKWQTANRTDLVPYVFLVFEHFVLRSVWGSDETDRCWINGNEILQMLHIGSFSDTSWWLCRISAECALPEEEHVSCSSADRASSRLTRHAPPTVGHMFGSAARPHEASSLSHVSVPVRKLEDTFVIQRTTRSEL